jgi:CubicO group peptidase (beta-lactamase class C family)
MVGEKAMACGSMTINNEKYNLKNMPVKKFLSLLICSLAMSFVAGQSIIRLDNSKISFADLDNKIQSLMTAANIQGMEIAVFNNNEPVYKKAFGYKRFDTKEVLKTNTNIYGASLSKAVFAVLVMKLVEEGVISLDKPLQDYLPKPIYDYPPSKKWHDNYSDLKGDTLYKKITARMCLDHTTGFPNWRFFESDQKIKGKVYPWFKV